MNLVSELQIDLVSRDQLSRNQLSRDQFSQDQLKFSLDQFIRL